MRLIRLIYSLTIQRERERENKTMTNHETIINYLTSIEDYIINELKAKLPHGSGINGDWTISFNWKKDQIHCKNSFHCMNECGMYDGYADFTLSIPFNSTENEFSIVFNGKQSQYKNRKYGLREYLEDTFHYWLEDKELPEWMGLNLNKD